MPRGPLRRWDERGYALRWTYDALRRPLELFVTKDAAPEALAERTVWGEGHVDALAKNLHGRPFQRYDGAGVVTSEAYDFRGNLLASTRRLRSDYASQVAWPFAGLSDIDDLLAAAEASLELESFGSATAYDALNRPTSLTTPDVRPTYDAGGRLEAVDARERGCAGMRAGSYTTQD